MSTDKDHAAWVTNYLNNELDVEDKNLFELELDKNQALQEEMKLQQSVNKAIEDHFSIQNEKILWESYQDLTKDAPVFPERKTVSLMVRFGQAAALILTSFVFFSIIFITMYNPIITAKNTIQDTELFSGTRSFKETTRGERKNKDVVKKSNEQSKNNSNQALKVSERLDKIKIFLEKDDYKSAIPELEKAKEQAEAKGSVILFEIKWILANAYTAIEEYDKAIAQYQEIIDKENADYVKEKERIKTAKKNIWILKAKNLF